MRGLPKPFSSPGSASAGIRATWARVRRRDEANDEEALDTYSVADARLTFAAHRWEIQGIVRNVLDARFATFGTFNLNQGAGNR